jgi:mono/diheme cytochrome c family protein
MKKILKIFVIVLASIVILIGFALLYIGTNDIPSYEVKTIEFTASITPESVERGKKLATMLCASCHLNRETGKLTGKKMRDAPPEFGEVYSQNITQDKEYGIGSWTDGEILYLLRTGIKKDGQYSPPYMAKLPNMADEDINAIIAFLRSDNSMVAADATPDQPCKPSLLTKLLSRIAFKPFDMPKERIEMPNPENKIELGAYLLHNLDCFSCHSADFKTNNYLNPKLSKGYLAGGNKPLDEQGRVMFTPNITSDKENGIGSWTKEDFVKAVKYGIKKESKSLTYPMIPYSQLSDYEAEAIFAYLLTVPPIKNKVERSVYN